MNLQKNTLSNFWLV